MTQILQEWRFKMSISNKLIRSGLWWLDLCINLAKLYSSAKTSNTKLGILWHYPVGMIHIYNQLTLKEVNLENLDETYVQKWSFSKEEIPSDIQLQLRHKCSNLPFLMTYHMDFELAYSGLYLHNPNSCNGYFNICIYPTGYSLDPIYILYALSFCSSGSILSLTDNDRY